MDPERSAPPSTPQNKGVRTPSSSTIRPTSLYKGPFRYPPSDAMHPVKWDEDDVNTDDINWEHKIGQQFAGFEDQEDENGDAENGSLTPTPVRRDSKGRPIGPDHPSVRKAHNHIGSYRKPKGSDLGDPNGRQKGRQLVSWHKPRMVEKLILHLQYEAARDKYTIPWDRIVHRLCPGSSGPAAVQFLNKTRDVLITEGHLVPPALGKPGQALDPTIRGYVRDMRQENPYVYRTIGWAEEYPDDESRTDHGIVRGSGKYDRSSAKRKETPKKPSTRGPRQEGPIAREPTTSQSRRAHLKRERSSDDDLGGVDLAELASSDEYQPNVTNNKKARFSKKKMVVESDSDDSDDSLKPLKDLVKSKSMMTPPGSSKVVKLHVGKANLQQLEARQRNPEPSPFITQPGSARNPGSSSFKQRLEEAKTADPKMAKSSPLGDTTPALEVAVQQFDQEPECPGPTYNGMSEHGTFEEFGANKRNGRDPRYSGLNYKGKVDWSKVSIHGGIPDDAWLSPKTNGVAAVEKNIPEGGLAIEKVNTSESVMVNPKAKEDDVLPASFNGAARSFPIDGQVQIIDDDEAVDHTHVVGHTNYSQTFDINQTFDPTQLFGSLANFDPNSIENAATMAGLELGHGSQTNDGQAGAQTLGAGDLALLDNEIATAWDRAHNSMPQSQGVDVGDGLVQYMEDFGDGEMLPEDFQGDYQGYLPASQSQFLDGQGVFSGDFDDGSNSPYYSQPFEFVQYLNADDFGDDVPEVPQNSEY